MMIALFSMMVIGLARVMQLGSKKGRGDPYAEGYRQSKADYS
jgi:hypothetical protein